MPTQALRNPRSRFLFALLAGTLLWALAVTALQWPRLGDGENRRFTGAQLQALGLSATPVENALQVAANETPVRGVITTGPIEYPAGERDVIRLAAPGMHPATGARVFWRTAAAPQAFESLPVEMTRGGHLAFGMQDVSTWSGTITELGVLLTGPVPESIEIESLEAGPVRITTLWGVLWTQWLSFQPWKQASINYVALSRGVFLSPVLAVALWILSVWLSGRVLGGRSRWNWRWAGTVFLVGWVLLDLRFQADLWFRLSETRFSYAGKDTEAKLAASPDAALHALAQDFLAKVDVTDTRVFIISDEPEAVRGYQRFRTHYFLLPINGFSMFRDPGEAGRLRKGDVLLIVGPHSRLQFDPDRRELAWDDQRIQATRVYQTDAATAYRVEGGER